jgi:DNA-binding response OmpR family regulator
VKKPKVLVVDDEPDICEILGVFLEDNGYRFLQVTDGKQAIAKVEKEKPEIVILDVAMPKMSGLEVLRRIKKDSKETNVILITAYQDAEKVVEAFHLGADDLIFKPFNFKYLKKVLSSKISD